MGSGEGVRCMLMRGGTSKGAYFLAEDLPADQAERDELLLRVMGSPDARQIDGIGGAHPLTSKVAVISPSARAGAFAPDTREDILRAADICLDQGVFIETGPHKHAIQQTFFLYVYEPGGNRNELANPAARLVLAPDWRTITWTEAERARGQAWGLKTIESFHTHGTPPVA